MFGLEPWQLSMYLGLIAVALAGLALVAAIIVIAVDDTAHAVAGYIVRRRSHLQSPEVRHD